MTELFTQLLDWVAANPGWAHLVIFLVALTESLAVIGLVVPGVLMMVAAGALIAAGALQFWPVCLWAVAGAVAGDGLSYWIGRHFKDRIRTVWPFTRHPQTLESGVRFFQRYGGKSVAFGRFIGPGRAIIPLVAGMMDMPPVRFFVANVLSALAWAPAYLLPGIVFGASLELAAEAAVRLVLALVLVVGLVWLAAWGTRRLFGLFSPRAGRWVEGLLRWADLHPRAGEVARALADPHHPDARTLAALAGVLLLATVLFGVLAGLALTATAELTINRTGLDLAVSLHTPPADHLLTGLGRLGGLPVSLTLIVGVWAWLMLRGRRRHANYWLAAGAFSLLAPPLVQVLLQVQRPDIGLADLPPWSFPSGHVLRATVLYGFLAVSLSAALHPSWRWLPYTTAAMLTAAVSVSRLYFGAVWITDVLGSLALGLAWTSALGLALRRHTAGLASWRGLAATAVAAALVAFAVQGLVAHDSELARYRTTPETLEITAQQWHDVLWRNIPQRRDDLAETNEHPLNVQYAGHLDRLTHALSAEGWRPAPMLGLGNFVKLLSPSLPLSQLPVVPHVHDGRHAALALVRDLSEDRRLVLRLWPTRYRIGAEGTPLWVGNVTAQEKDVLVDWIAIPRTTDEHARAFAQLRADAAVLPARLKDDGRLLLLEAPRPGRPRT